MSEIKNAINSKCLISLIVIYFNLHILYTINITITMQRYIHMIHTIAWYFTIYGLYHMSQQAENGKSLSLKALAIYLRGRFDKYLNSPPNGTIIARESYDNSHTTTISQIVSYWTGSSILISCETAYGRVLGF